MIAPMESVIELLVVDDNAGDVRLTCVAVERSGLRSHVTIARDGEEAMAFLRRSGKFATVSRPHLVLLDINMPRLTGLEVLEQARQDAALAGLPIIMLTGSDSERDMDKATSLGASAYLLKPLCVDDLLNAIHHIEPRWLAAPAASARDEDIRA